MCWTSFLEIQPGVLPQLLASETLDYLRTLNVFERERAHMSLSSLQQLLTGEAKALDSAVSNTALHCHERCAGFATALLSARALCPRCWVLRDQVSEMVAICSGSIVSRFECYECKFTVGDLEGHASDIESGL